MRNIVLPAFTAFVTLFVFTSFAETVVQWTGAGGDMDLTNPDNWPDSTLPESPTYGAKLTATTEENPYTMLKATSLQSYTINLSDSLTLDLGKGNSFLAPYRVYVNTTGKTFNLKSGTFGVDWSSTSGERFFIGDSGSGGNTFNVSGEDSVLMSSYKNNIQVGTNQGRQRLNVTDGATVNGNMIVGSNVGCHSNVTWIANASHVVPASSEATPLTVGALGGWNTYVLTNGASFASERVANIYMSGAINHAGGPGHNRIVVADHSSFSSVSTVDIGYSGDDNGLILTDGSTLACKVLNLASETDRQAASIVDGNFIRASGAGTKISTTSNATIGGYAINTELWLNDGAEMSVDDTLSFGGAGASTNTFAYFGTNTILDVKNGFAISPTTSTGVRDAHVVLDGGKLYFTNTVNAARTAYFNGNGVSNGMEFVNGAYGLFASPGGNVIVGSHGSARGGYLKVRGADTRLQLYDQNVYLGSEEGAQDGYFLIDGATVAITNFLASRNFRVGSKGRNNLMEITNGGCLTFSNMNFGVSTGGEPCMSNVLRIANGGRVVGRISANVSDAVYIGLYGVGGLDVDGGSLLVPQMLRIAHTNSKADGSWMRIRNGGYVEVNRVIVGETSKNHRIYIDNGTLRTLNDSIQLGTVSDKCSGDGLYITGTNAFVRSGGGVSLSPKSFIQFDLGRYGLCTTGAVVYAASNVTGTALVTADDPVTVRITDDDPERIEGGKYTLIESKNGKISWDLIKIECPPTVRIVEKTEKKLVVRVPSRKGMTLLVR